MEFFDVVHTRQTVRQFMRKPIEPDKLERILQAANAAPSAGNRQAYEIYVVRADAQRDPLVKASLGQEFLEQAPVVLIFCTHPQRNADRYGERGASLYCLQDATIACTFAMLAATDLGLASAWVGAFQENIVHTALKLPEGQRPIIMLSIGYPAELPVRRTRRHLEELVHEL